mmetsp:Transcript_1321/g.1860  ORF Transcript_1321/g.1860 Transcript_1321/m.1860 type:complete len:324 (+) Transcript_1321:1300-2271(+)
MPYLYYIIINQLIPKKVTILNIKKCILCLILSSSSKSNLLKNKNITALFYSDDYDFKNYLFKILGYYNQELIEFNTLHDINKYKLSSKNSIKILNQNYSHKFFLQYSDAFVLIDHFESIDFDSKLLIEEIITYGKISLNYYTKIYSYSCSPKIFCWYNIQTNKFKKLDLVRNMMENFYLVCKFDFLFKNYNDKSRLLNFLNKTSEHNLLTPKTFSFPKTILRKYLLFAKSYVEPIISKDKLNYLIYYYLNLRLLNKKIKNLLPSIHFLYSILKVSVALAKINCSLSVNFSHLKEAIKITNSSLLYNKYYFIVKKNTFNCEKNV